MRRLSGLAVLFALATGAPGTAAQVASPAGCPSHIDDARFASDEALGADNQRMADFGPRPTAGPAHAEFIAWLEDELEAVPEMTVESVPYTIDRWSASPTGR